MPAEWKFMKIVAAVAGGTWCIGSWLKALWETFPTCLPCSSTFRALKWRRTMASSPGIWSCCLPRPGVCGVPFTNKWRAFRQPQSRVFLRLFEFLPSWQQQLYAARKLEATTNTEFCLTADKAIASAEIADGDGDAGSIHTHSEKCPTRKTNIPKSNILFDLYAHFSHSAVVVTDTSQR